MRDLASALDGSVTATDRASVKDRKASASVVKVKNKRVKVVARSVPVLKEVKTEEVKAQAVEEEERLTAREMKMQEDVSDDYFV